MKRLLLFIALVSVAHGAGTVQQNVQNIGGNVYAFSFNWTGDAVSGSVPATVAQGSLALQGYRVISMETTPGSPAPTNAYSITLIDNAGVDIMANAAASLSSTSAQSFAGSPTAPPLYGSFTFTVTGNSVGGAKGSAVVYLAPLSQVLGLSPTAPNFPSQGANLIFASPNGASGSPGFRSLAVPGDLGSSVVPVANGGTGVTTAQGNGSKVQLSTGTTTTNDCVKFDANGNTIDAGAGCSSTTLPSGTQTQYLQIKPNTGNNTTTQFANIPVVSTGDYNFPAYSCNASLICSPGGSTGGTISSGPTTLTMTPCPLGMNGADANHPVYLSAGSGAAEAPVITSGTCTSGAATGTIVFTAANSHSGAFTVTSATTGIRECFIAAALSPTASNPTRACYTPSGIWNIYNTLYDDTNVTWFGDGVSSVIQQQFVGDGIIVGQSTYGTGDVYFSVRNLFGQYGFGGGTFGTSGNVWTFRNMADTDVSNLYSFLGFNGFKFFGVTQGNWVNLWEASANFGYWFICTTAGSCPANANAGAFTNIWGTVQPGGSVIRIEPIIGGLHLNNLNIGAGAQGVDIVPNATGVIDELVLSGGFIDSLTGNALISRYSASGPFASQEIIVDNIRFTTTGASTNTVINLNAPQVFKFTNCTFYNGGTSGDILTLSGTSKSSFSNNQMDGNVVTSRIVFQNGSGAELVTDNMFVGNMIGFNGASLTNAIASDNNAHAGNRFIGNKFKGTVNSPGTGANNYFDFSNQGLPINAVASAATLPIPPFPIFTVTGTTGVTAVSGCGAGQVGKFTTTTGAVAFTAGATIGDSLTTVQNVPVEFYCDGTKIWLK